MRHYRVPEETIEQIIPAKVDIPFFRENPADSTFKLSRFIQTFALQSKHNSHRCTGLQGHTAFLVIFYYTRHILIALLLPPPNLCSSFFYLYLPSCCMSSPFPVHHFFPFFLLWQPEELTFYCLTHSKMCTHAQKPWYATHTHARVHISRR